MKHVRFVMAAIALLGLSMMLGGCASVGAGLGEAFGGEHGRIIGRNLGHAFDVMGGVNAGMTNGQPAVVVEAPQPQVVVVQQQPVYAPPPVVQQEMMIAPVEIGVPVYGLPLPEGVIAYRGHYDYYTYENVNGIMILTYWNNGGIRVYADERWDHGRRMEYGHWGEWHRNYRVSREHLAHHQAEMNRHRAEVQHHAARVQQERRHEEVQKHEAKEQQKAAQKAAQPGKQALAQRAPAPQQKPAAKPAAKPAPAKKDEKK